MTLYCTDLAELDDIAKKIVTFAESQTIWAFEGAMGTGKTTLIQHIGKFFGIDDAIQSPTFALVNEYQNKQQQTFYHFDFYRIRHETEALDIGCEEYFTSGKVCWIEWPTKIPHLLPPQYLLIQLALEYRENAIYRRIELSQI